jgi:protein phosphatase PTC7
LDAVERGTRVCCLPCLTQLMPAEESYDDEDEDEDEEVDDTPDEEEELDDTPVNDGGGNSESRALRMDCASCYLPDHGEDAHFTVPEAGVVGVGACRDRGVDASAFARALMMHASAVASRAGTKHVSPYRQGARRGGALGDARRVDRAGRVPPRRDARVGVRRGQRLRRAARRQGRAPLGAAAAQLQLPVPAQRRGGRPSRRRRRGRGAGGGRRRRGGRDGRAVRQRVRRGGVELECIVQKGAEMGISAQLLAEKIATTALKASESWGPTPFSLASSRNVTERVRGGKTDDITVVFGYIVPKDS